MLSFIYTSLSPSRKSVRKFEIFFSFWKFHQISFPTAILNQANIFQRRTELISSLHNTISFFLFLTEKISSNWPLHCPKKTCLWNFIDWPEKNFGNFFFWISFATRWKMNRDSTEFPQNSFPNRVDFTEIFFHVIELRYCIDDKLSTNFDFFGFFYCDILRKERESINQSINPSINQSIKQAINRSIDQISKRLRTSNQSINGWLAWHGTMPGTPTVAFNFIEAESKVSLPTPEKMFLHSGQRPDLFKIKF